MNFYIFSLFWPQINVSAASVRTIGIVHTLLKNLAKVHYVCSAKKSKLEMSDIKKYLNVQVFNVDSYDLNAMNKMLSKLQNEPEVAIFDTFAAEEMFSHHIYQKFPNCLRVLDLQDIHSLRAQRQEFAREKLPDNSLCTSELLAVKPHPADNTLFARELASIIRSDLIITCSDYEQILLREKLKINNVGLNTFFYMTSPENQDDGKKFDFSERKHFAWIGNHNHPPNLDSLHFLVHKLWKGIKEKLPKAELHIYGANFNKEFSNLSKTDPSIKSMGHMNDLKTLSKYKALLAPLRFGAGIKGKIADSWNNYLPVITTRVGAEGMFNNTFDDRESYKKIDLESRFFKEEEDEKAGTKKGQMQVSIEPCAVRKYYESYGGELYRGSGLEFGGLFENDTVEQFVESCERIYTDEALWKQSIEIGRRTLKERMSLKMNEVIFLKNVGESHANMFDDRRKNNIQALTWSETLRSTQNFAKYINEKNKKGKE